MADEAAGTEILVISGSLNPESRSRVLAREITGMLKARSPSTEMIDLRDYPLPLCDGENAYDHPNVGRVKPFVSGARAIIVAVPVYNFDVNAAVKNLVELTGSAWERKVVGFLCAAGGGSSYMSVMSFANSLMLDFRCLIIPRFVYAVSGDFGETHGGEDVIQNPKIRERLEELADITVKLAGAMF
jgi:NAD(P)H-dependent FMN reductase